MSERPLHVAFVWHMHQPYYKDLVSGLMQMPWVRLHGIKDYYDMPAILDAFPSIRQTFNLVPSLIAQIQDYVQGGTSDTFLEWSRYPAADLGKEEKVAILKNFFMANWERMIRVHPRYLELLVQRGSRVSDRELERIAGYFTAQDFLDLQVWFNLAWFDPMFQKDDPMVREMVLKDRGYTESEKLALLERQRDILAQIVPVYKRLQEKDQIELSTSPFYHPILPLLCDTDIAKMATPHAPLPLRRFTHPEDAIVQVKRAVAFHADAFGRPPRGMWPSEGSVSEALLPILTDAGIQWLATDDEILRESMALEGSPETTGWMGRRDSFARPYWVESEGRRLAAVFRDHALSDRIGFVYAHWQAQDAVEDFIARLHAVRKEVTDEPGPRIVSIILDGENAWEHYKNDGHDFFNRLYERLSEEPLLPTTTVGAFLDQHPPERTLHRLFAGSWIGHNFLIWIGHEEDNQAWDLLTRAREALVEASSEESSLDPSVLARAWEELYIAEGSDWCWWYGGQHFGMLAEFDELYRKHLSNIYTLIGRDIPDELHISILRREKYEKPTREEVGFINPEIDGRVTDYFEWLSAGVYDVDKTGGAMHRTDRVLSRVYYGFDLVNLYFRLDCLQDLNEAESKDLEFYFHFLKPRILRLVIERESGRIEGRLLERGSDESWKEVERISRVAIDEVVEAAVPFESIGAKAGEEIQLYVSLRQKGHELERWPQRGTISIQRPTEEYEAIRWSV